MNTSKHFASDNYSGIHQQILEAIVKTNTAHDTAYGDDRETARFAEIVHKKFGEEVTAFPVFNGTAANVLALQTLLPRWGAVICAETAHINVDEGGAPERVGGLKLLTVRSADGKITPESIRSRASGYGDVHRAQPLAVSISQSTELGTTYTKEEIIALTKTAHEHGMAVHMDGSRLANAAASLGTELKEITFDLGIDALSLGATKNGAMGAEAVLLKTSQGKNRDEPHAIEYLRKMNLQLASKMRFISAQLNALYEGDLWLQNAQRSNDMASLLAKQLEEKGVEITRPVESNAVFVRLDKETAAHATKRFMFYDWPAGEDEYRLMCSFDTTPEEVTELADLLS